MTQTLNYELIVRIEINCINADHYELLIKKAKQTTTVYITEGEAKNLQDIFNIYIQND